MRLELKLKEIHLQNFRLFDDLKVSFDEQLTVFISENGAGKTSLLDGIAKTLIVFTQTMFHGHFVGVHPDLSDNDIQYGKKSLTISKSISYKLDNIASDEKISRTKQLLRTDIQSQLGTLNLVVKKIRDAFIQDKLEALPIVMYYPAVRANFGYASDESKNTIFSIYENALIGTPMIYKHFLEWYVWQSQMAIFSKTPNHVLQQVQSAILSLLNDHNEKVYEELYIDPSQYKNPRLMVSKNGNKLEINQLSSGEKNLFVLVSDLARRLCLANPKSTNPLKEGQGVVLIDEIDLHLHPQWQRKILTKLQSIFPNIQWVVTTHSPQILGEIQKGKIYILDNQKAHLLDFNPYGKDMNRLLDQIMGVRERNETVLKELDTYFELIERNELEKALKIRQSLEQKMGTDEPLFLRADGIIKRKQLIGR